MNIGPLPQRLRVSAVVALFVAGLVLAWPSAARASGSANPVGRELVQAIDQVVQLAGQEHGMGRHRLEEALRRLLIVLLEEEHHHHHHHHHAGFGGGIANLANAALNGSGGAQQAVGSTGQTVSQQQGQGQKANRQKSTAQPSGGAGALVGQKKQGQHAKCGGFGKGMGQVAANLTASNPKTSGQTTTAAGSKVGNAAGSKAKTKGGAAGAVAGVGGAAKNQVSTAGGAVKHSGGRGSAGAGATLGKGHNGSSAGKGRHGKK
jgi:hypothetical protein